MDSQQSTPTQTTQFTQPQYKKPFYVWIFCEPDGTPSFARVGTAVLMAFVCGWVTAIVRWTRTIPELAGIALFMTCLYGVNKVTALLKRD